jgi:hypothetical protein
VGDVISAEAIQGRGFDIVSDRPPGFDDLCVHDIGATWHDESTGDVYVYTDGLPPAWLLIQRGEKR